MNKYMIEMNFFQKKYETCIQEGMRAKYPRENVEEVCGNKLIKFIRGNNDKL